MQQDTVLVERLPGKWFGAAITAGIDLAERLGPN